MGYAGGDAPRRVEDMVRALRLRREEQSSRPVLARPAWADDVPRTTLAPHQFSFFGSALLDLGPQPGQPVLGQPRPKHLLPIENQRHLALALPHQAAEEAN